MATGTTSLSSVLAGALLSFGCSSHAAPLVKCPSVNADGARTGLLADADLFQGPPEEKASMIPDLETSVWDLHGYRENSEARGESLYLVCRYTGIKATVQIEVPRAATFCRVTYTRNGKSAFCGAESTGTRKKLAKRS